MIGLLGLAASVVGYLNWPDIFGPGTSSYWIFCGIINAGIFIYSMKGRS